MKDSFEIITERVSEEQLKETLKLLMISYREMCCEYDMLPDWAQQAVMQIARMGQVMLEKEKSDAPIQLDRQKNGEES